MTKQLNLRCESANINANCINNCAFARDYEANEAEYDKKKPFDPSPLADGKAWSTSVEERIDVFDQKVA